jgi:hypothetical protein
MFRTNSLETALQIAQEHADRDGATRYVGRSVHGSYFGDDRREELEAVGVPLTQQQTVTPTAAAAEAQSAAKWRATVAAADALLEEIAAATPDDGDAATLAASLSATANDADAPTEEDAPRVFWCCPDCQSVRVEAQMWVDPNTFDISNDTDRYRWCNACEEAGENGEKKTLDQLPWAETLEGRSGDNEPCDV